VAPDGEELTDDAITAAYRVYQRRRGHRYSLDDVATAWVAGEERPGARTVLDLGCGIGSVALMLAHVLPEAHIVGIEAQDVSLALARRNVHRNGLGARVSLVHGDLREWACGERFDLVTGTPPYFDPAKSSASTDAQRTYARIEMRGGIEDYVRAGARALAPGGALVVCGDARRPDRALAAAQSAGVRPVARRDVVPREGKGALFTIWVFAEHGELEERAPIVARDASGARTDDARAMREFFGLSAR
jgi:FkbM family methyltransferase